MADKSNDSRLQFIFEPTGLWAFGYWGWTQHNGPERWLWALGLPLLAVTIWNIFRVQKEAPVVVPGGVRLLLETIYFWGAVVALFAADRVTWAILYAVLVLVHYAWTYRRLVWLLGKGGKEKRWRTTR